MRLLGFAGMKGAGKDTAAAMLCERYGFRRVAFADALYQEVARAFGVTVDFLQTRDTKEKPTYELALSECGDGDFVACMLALESRRLTSLGFALDLTDVILAIPRSPRWVLQFWGTEYRRSVTDSYWRDQVEAQIRANPAAPWVVTDVRFPDESRLVERLGGEMARILLLDEQGRPARGSGVGEHHASERALDEFVFPVWENKRGDLSVLRAAVEAYCARCVGAEA